MKLKAIVSELSRTLPHCMLEGDSDFNIGRQRFICLTRALIRKNKILVLDEATAKIDKTDILAMDEGARVEFSFSYELLEGNVALTDLPKEIGSEMTH